MKQNNNIEEKYKNVADVISFKMYYFNENNFLKFKVPFIIKISDLILLAI